MDFDDMNVQELTKVVLVEFTRLIKLNHDIKNVEYLQQIFDKGFEIGSKLKRYDNFRNAKQRKIDFDIDKYFKDAIRKLKPKRFNNSLDFKYNGPEIDCSKILVVDFNVKQSLENLNLNDDIIRYDKTHEVYTMVVKLYQVAYSIGYKYTQSIPRNIVTLYEYIKNLEDYNNGASAGICNIRNHHEFGIVSRIVEKLKNDNPNWEEYKAFIKF